MVRAECEEPAQKCDQFVHRGRAAQEVVEVSAHAGSSRWVLHVRPEQLSEDLLHLGAQLITGRVDSHWHPEPFEDSTVTDEGGHIGAVLGVLELDLVVPGTHIRHKEVATASLELAKDCYGVALWERVADKEIFEAGVINHKARFCRIMGFLYKEALGKKPGDLFARQDLPDVTLLDHGVDHEIKSVPPVCRCCTTAARSGWRCEIFAEVESDRFEFGAMIIFQCFLKDVCKL